MRFSDLRHRDEMLKAVGAKAPGDLFPGVQPLLGRPLILPAAMSEMELAAHMSGLSGKNTPHKCFTGAGAYDHYTPSAMGHILLRSEFYTAYTPYQAEVSQGTLQAIYEFQTYMCRLTGMDVANASMYDGATALAESAFMACDATGRDEIAVIAPLNPAYMKVLQTYCEAHSVKIADEVTDKTACAIVQNPDYEGSVRDIKPLAEKAHSCGALLIVTVIEGTSLALIEPPGSLGADIVAGEGQSFGLPLSFGGPYLGCIATKKDLMKRIPGRLCGMTADSQGRRGFVLTLQAREQHIRRERASSNICSNQALCALGATVYLSLVGRSGLRGVALKSYKNAHDLAEKLARHGFRLHNTLPFYNEFTVHCPAEPQKILAALRAQGINGGVDIGGKKLLVACTEKLTGADIDHYVQVAAGVK